MSAEGAKFRTGGRIPDLRRPISRSAGQAFAIRAEGHAVDPVSVPFEGEEFLAGLGIPDLHLPSDEGLLGVIPGATTGGQALAVRAEGHVPATASEGEEFLAGLRIPHFHIPRSL